MPRPLSSASPAQPPAVLRADAYARSAGPLPPGSVSPASVPSGSPTPGMMAADALSLDRSNLLAKLPFKLPVKPAHNGGWDELGQLVTSMLFSPAASLLGAGIGFLVGGPVGAAIGAGAGGAAVGLGYAAGNLFHHFRHVMRKEDTDNGFNLKLAAEHLIMPGLTAIGAGVGFALGGPVGAALGGVLGSGAIALVVATTMGIDRLRRPANVPPEPETPPPGAGAL